MYVLNVRGIGAVVKNCIEKDDKEALKYVVDKAMEKAYYTYEDMKVVENDGGWR